MLVLKVVIILWSKKKILVRVIWRRLGGVFVFSVFFFICFVLTFYSIE